MSADPVRKLWDSHIPILDPIALFVVMGHASDSINRLEGACHIREGFAQGGGGESKIVGVGAGSSLEEQLTSRQLYAGSKAMVNKEAVRRATLTHRSRHSKLDHGQRQHARREVLFPRRNFCKGSGTPARSNTMKIHLRPTLEKAQEKSVRRIQGS